MNNKKIRIIAFYLPQFHPIPENDKWWGKGFTEWTNVGKAKPLFRGHYQPKIPADLGYYDLRLPIVREQQVKLAQEAGIEGFMYWHYWFGNGKQLMSDIFDDVLKSGKPEFPFCLGWANHSWYAKDWNSNDSKKDQILIEQTYLGEKDYRDHFEKVLQAFKDPRYIKMGNKPIFLIFDTLNLPTEFISLWNEWAKKEGFTDGIYFIGYIKSHQVNSKVEVLTKGYSAVTFERIKEVYFENKIMLKFLNILANKILRNRPIFAREYKKAYPAFVNKIEDSDNNVIPCLLPNWDHTPRSGKKGLLLVNSTPEHFKEFSKMVLDIVKQKENKLIFLKSWNEWGEGNYMEPDLKFGNKYIYALREAIEENINSENL